MPSTSTTRRRRAAALCLAALAYAAPAGASDALTLDHALRLTQEHHPRVRAALREADAADALRGDAARRPNPVLSAQVENLGGGVLGDARESQLVFSQPFELGGDRAARAGLAGARLDAARAALALERLERAAETAELFLDAWVLQERAARHAAAVTLARTAVAAAAARLTAGAAPAYEQRRAEGFLALREIEVARTLERRDAALDRLAQQWARAETFDSLSLGAPPLETPPDDAALLPLAGGHPARARADALRREGEWRVRLERALRTPDVSVDAGVRRLHGPEATGFVVGLAMPLPLWNRSRGAVAAAEAERDAATLGADAVERDLERRLRAARARLVSALDAYRRIEAQVVPAAESAMAQIADAYRTGRLGYLDIQEGQRHLLEADLMRIDAHAEIWRARGELGRLTSADIGGQR